MLKKKCSKCDKIIEGYTEKQIDYLLSQHRLARHKQEDKKNE